MSLNESHVGEAALNWLASLGDSVLHGPNIAAGESAAERSDPNYRDVVLEGPLQGAALTYAPYLHIFVSDDPFGD